MPTKMLKLISGGLTALMLAGVMPITGLAFSNLNLVSATEVTNSQYTLEVEATTTDTEDPKVQYQSQNSADTWISMTAADEENHYTASGLTLAEGENIFTVRIADADNTTLVMSDFTVTYTANFHLESAASTSTDSYQLELSVDEVPFLGKVQYRPDTQFAIWIDMAREGDNYTATVNLQEGANELDVRVVNSSNTVVSEDVVVVTYVPYDVELVSNNEVVTENYTLKVRASAADLTNKVVQYRVPSAIVPTWANMEAQGDGTYTADLTLAVGANTYEVRIGQSAALGGSVSELHLEEFTVTRLTLTPVDPTNTCVHDDLPADYEYCDAVEFNYDLGTFTGDGEGNFRAEDGVNRAEAAKILNVAKDVDLSAYDVDGTAGFSDTIDGEWYIQYLNASKDNGVITGYPDGTFGPENVVIRAEFAAMITRALEIDLEGSCDAEYAADIYEDTYWTEAACFLVANEYIELNNGSFDPEAPMTREDIARMIFAMETYFDVQ